MKTGIREIRKIRNKLLTPVRFPVTGSKKRWASPLSHGIHQGRAQPAAASHGRPSMPDGRVVINCLNIT
jgi:hypothetical protein